MLNTMKAARIHSYGAPDVLTYEEAPRPVAEAGEVLIRVHAAGVNPVDWKTRKGMGVASDLKGLPAILGWDVAGTVEALGEGVTEFEAGDEVYGMIRFPYEGAAYAEYATAPVEDLARKPKSLDFVQAAGVPLAALTAWQALFEGAKLEAGQTVLVHAAAGGVGHIAVQLARWKGARVIGTASARNLDLVRELGAGEVIDYTAAPFESVAPQVDVVLDNVGGETLDRSFPVVRPGGVLITIAGHPSQERAAEHGIRAERVVVRPHSGQLAEMARLIDAGELKILVDTVLPLSEARAAHELSESRRARGKIVLQVS